jgi:hypothetical protein
MANRNVIKIATPAKPDVILSLGLSDEDNVVLKTAAASNNSRVVKNVSGLVTLVVVKDMVYMSKTTKTVAFIKEKKLNVVTLKEYTTPKAPKKEPKEEAFYMKDYFRMAGDKPVEVIETNASIDTMWFVAQKITLQMLKKQKHEVEYSDDVESMVDHHGLNCVFFKENKNLPNKYYTYAMIQLDANDEFDLFEIEFENYKRGVKYVKYERVNDDKIISDTIKQRTADMIPLIPMIPLE